MSTEEKAKDLYKKYKTALDIRDMRPGANEYVIKCCLIAVDEILEFIKTMWTHESAETTFWKEVKAEINKM